MNPIKWLEKKIQDQIDVRVNPQKIASKFSELHRRLEDAEIVLEKLRCPHPRDARSIRTRGTDVVVCTECNAALAVWEDSDKPTTTPKAPMQ